MTKELLSPKNDLVFKLIFGDKNNTDILTDFLQAILDLPAEEYESVSIADPNFRLEEAGGKFGILDLKVYTKSGKIIDVEIQAFSVPDMRERIVYYTSKLVTEQLGEGDVYKRIKKAVTIVITDFTMIEDSGRYHNKYRFRDKESGSEFTDIMEIHTLELPKIPGETDNSALWNWLKFFNAKGKEDYMPLTKENPRIGKAVGILLKLSEDEKTRMLAESRLKAWRDEQSRAEFAREEGMKEGIEKGREEALRRTVRRMQAAGLSAEQISVFTGLSATDAAKYMD